MDSLRHCPFCGGEAEIHPTYDCDSGEVDGYFVWCGNYECECKPETGQFSTEAEAIAAWNTRAERTCHMDEYEAAPFSVCSECGAVLPDDCTVYYCPSCGAKVVEK